jgi:cytochrome P450
MSLKALDDIHGTRSETSKAPFYDHVLRSPKLPASLVNVMYSSVSHFLINSDKTRHAMLRRVIGPSFRSSSLNEFEPSLKRFCYELMALIQRMAANGTVVDMDDLFNRLSFDVFPKA